MRAYSRMKNISIDYQIMERIKSLYCVKGDFLWHDMGNWRSLEKIYKKDKSGNIVIGRAGLVDVSVHQIEVRRTFASFDDYWRTSRLGPGVGQVITSMPAVTSDTLKSRVRARLSAGDGPVTVAARANAVKGRVAGH